MKKIIISVLFALTVFAFIGCDTTTENNEGSGYDMIYLGYEASQSEGHDLAKSKGYNNYAYFENGSCYGSYK